MSDVRSLLAELPTARGGEVVELLLAAKGVRLERIVSHGQSSPAGFWYDQPEAEWVMLIAGAARLAIEGEAAEVALTPGDTMFLPARRRHRVAWTHPSETTVWLALFLDAALQASPPSP